MPDPILYTILHPYAFHQFVLKILSGNEVGITDYLKTVYPHTSYVAETSHGRNSIIGKVNSRLYFDE